MSDNKISNQVHIVETLLGIFAIGEDYTIVEFVQYPIEAKKISVALERQEKGIPSKEMKEILEKLIQRGFNSVILSNETLTDTLSKYNLKVLVESYSEPEKYVRENIESIGVELGVVQDKSQFYSISREVSTLRARNNIQKTQSERGATIIQTVQLINELDKSLNILTGKLREWYSLHFPELNRIIDDHRLYVNLIEKIGNKNNFSFEKLEAVGVQARKNSILEARNTSMGADLQTEDEDYLIDLAKNLGSLYHYRDSIEHFIKNIAEEAIPNLSIVAGPVLAAKLVEKAGGLKKLAMMPSSTLQLLGAEKALFRSKKTKAKPPKHGLIFQHPYVNSKPRNLRGKAARTLAAKLSIAARADAFSGNPVGIDLRKQLYGEPKIEDL